MAARTHLPIAGSDSSVLVVLYFYESSLVEQRCRTTLDYAVSISSEEDIRFCPRATVFYNGPHI